MITTIITDEYPLFLPPPDVPRSPGVHVSGIIRCIATETGILKPEWAEELSLVDARSITDPVALLRISIGLAIEQYYIPRVLAEYGVEDHPEEVYYDGVYMSPDGEDVSVIITVPSTLYANRIHEVKATYKSTKTVGDVSGQWMWLAQIKAYCAAKGTRFAVLHVWYMCGDYKYPIKPIRVVYNLEFTQEEIDDNWSLLRDYKEEFEGKRIME